MTELKPCPFCGGRIEARHSRFSAMDGFQPLLFCCRECGAMVSFDDMTANIACKHGDDSVAIDLFNARYEQTCTFDLKIHGSYEDWVCSNCGHIENDGIGRYCSNCGCKVVKP